MLSSLGRCWHIEYKDLRKARPGIVGLLKYPFQKLSHEIVDMAEEACWENSLQNSTYFHHAMQPLPRC